MPYRDRNHELETESQRAFEAALPASLVVRPVSDDYGIDREVEVFVDGVATGLTFKVQLKATDRSGASRRITRSHLEYWRSLDVPVLLVSYEASSRVLRGRWVHSIGADAPDTGAKTMTIRMDPGIAFDDTWPARLASELSLIRSIRRGEVPVPTPVRVEVEEHFAGPPGSQVTAALLNLTRRTKAPMRKTKESDDAALTLALSARRIRAALPLHIASCTLHTPAGLYKQADPRQVAQVGLVLCACAVGTLDEDCARLWLQQVDPAGPWWAHPDLIEHLLPIVSSPDSADLLLAINAALVERDDPFADAYLVAVMENICDASDKAFESYSRQISSSLGIGWDSGRRAYNLAGLHRLRRDFPRAIELLNTAAERAPRYRNDPLFLRLLGSCEWEVEDFESAVEHYTLALDLGFDAHELRPLLANALMYAGRYAEARDSLGKWQPNGSPNDRVGILHRIILDNLLSFIGVSSQRRTLHNGQNRGDETLQSNDGPGMQPADAREALRRGDALNPSLWVDLIDQERLADSFETALTAAYLLRDHPAAWVIALVCALERETSEELLTAILNQARFMCGQSFYDAVWEFADEQEEEEAAILRELISSTYSSEAEELTKHIRGVDPSSAHWATDLLPPRRQSNDASERSES